MVYLYDQGYLRKFQYENVEVYVQLTEETDDDLLTVWTALLQLPAEDEQRLMRKLLTMNWEETLETKFEIINDKIVVLTQRSVAN
jgi:succinate dehydrogenase flavin-adding protein (antitoxin of CptAB toxin-antitoxin module)